MTKLLPITLFLGATMFGLYIHFTTTPTPQNPIEARNVMTIEEYVRKHIGTLSPERPVLGGTFYITDMQINPEAQTGTVWYEDGHIALVADFAYRTNDHEEITIRSFVVRK